MEFIKEYAAGTDFPAELSYSCFFQTKNGFYGLAAHKKQLFKQETNNSKAIDLHREYIKIVADSKGSNYFAYTLFSNKNEITIYYLDGHFKELDYQKIKKMEGGSWPVDLWFDGIQDVLYLVYPKAILKYNRNGDFLGIFMSASMNTVYSAMCTYENCLFLAYRRLNCSYVGLYCCDGAFKEHLSLGGDYQLCDMQVILERKCRYLRLHVIKRGEISLFCEVNFCEDKNPVESSYNASITETEDTKGRCIYVEMVKGDGIGEATYHLRSNCNIT